jgi:hypothetical protein
MDPGNVLVVVVLAILIGLLGAAAVYGLVVGLLAATSGERFVRCPTCGRFGLTVGGRRHPGGCPVAHARPWLARAHEPRLHHH